MIEQAMILTTFVLIPSTEMNDRGRRKLIGNAKKINMYVMKNRKQNLRWIPNNPRLSQKITINGAAMTIVYFQFIEILLLSTIRDAMGMMINSGSAPRNNGKNVKVIHCLRSDTAMTIPIIMKIGIAIIQNTSTQMFSNITVLLPSSQYTVKTKQISHATQTSPTTADVRR